MGALAKGKGLAGMAGGPERGRWESELWTHRPSHCSPRLPALHLLQPTLVFLLGKLHGQAWQATVHVVERWDTTGLLT